MFKLTVFNHTLDGKTLVLGYDTGLIVKGTFSDYKDDLITLTNASIIANSANSNNNAVPDIHLSELKVSNLVAFVGEEADDGLLI